MIVDLFSGAGGWDVALRSLGRDDTIGLEWDAAACRTRAAAGHRTVRCDVTTYPTAPFTDVEGLVASPPCQAFSSAGKGLGKTDVPRILAHAEACRDGWVPVDPSGWADPRSAPILEPLRWVWGLRPRWVACEQVQQCVGMWRVFADVLRHWGSPPPLAAAVLAQFVGAS